MSTASEHGSTEPVDILLVDDNPGDVCLTKGAFNDGQIANTLRVVEGGVDALDFLSRRNDYADVPRPDLVLLDLNLPRKDGDEVLEELHETLTAGAFRLSSSRVRKPKQTSPSPTNDVRAGT